MGRQSAAVLLIALAAGVSALDPATAMADNQPRVTVTMEPPVIPFYKQAQLTVAVEGAAGVEIAFPAPESLDGKLTVTPAAERGYTKLGDGRMRVSHSWLLDAVEPGEYALEPVKVQVEGETVEAPVPVLAVREPTHTELAALMRFAPNDAPMGPPFSLVRAWWFWLFVLLLVAAGVAAWFLRKRSSEPKMVAEALCFPWEKALARLAALENRGWPRAGRFESYFVVLSGIVRDYLTERYRVEVTEQTTPEFLALAGEFGLFTPWQHDLVAELLRLADKVKFARYEPSIRQMDDALASARRFVGETTPEPAEEFGRTRVEGAA